MKKNIYLFTLGIFIASFFGCASPQKNIELAKPVIDSYFTALKQKDFDKALSFYSPQFFKTTPRKEWKSALKKIISKLGTLQSYELVYSHSQPYYGTSVLILLDYKVKYSKYTSKESFSLVKSLGSNKIKILNHIVSSAGF